MNTRTLSITSGKGGVGKTSLTCNLALDLASRNFRTLILDGDLGMANADVMFGTRADKTIADVLAGRSAIEEVLLSVRPGIDLIPGGSGLYEMQNLNSLQKQNLLNQVSLLEDNYDFMLIDTAPGLHGHVLYLNAAAQEILVVITPDPASLTDAYALIKVLNQRHLETRFSVICNLVRDEAEGLQIYRRLSDVAMRFLCVGLDYRGFIPADPEMRKATKMQQLISEVQPRSQSSLAVKRLGDALGLRESLPNPKGGLQFFWQQLSGVA